METTTIKVPVGKVISSTDRKYGGEGNIEILAKSIQEHGLIHPIAVKSNYYPEGTYRVIAGRRRYAAVKSLGWKNVDVTVYPEKSDDEAIALAENVNREEMHPLDEAETFSRQLEEGKPVEEIAQYYCRSVSGIYQRIRLTNLVDNVKTMFRDGKIKLSGAALIASLPEEDQEKFCKKYEKKVPNKWDIEGFIHSVQRFKLEHITDTECENCKKRTRNTTPGLFEDYNGLEDVCFDGDCYTNKWQNFIAGMIAAADQPPRPTENNIIFERGFPSFLPKKSKTVTLAGAEYTLIDPATHSWEVTDNKSKTKTAWYVSLKWHDESRTRKVNVERVAYEKYERQSYGGGYVADPVKEYMVDQIPSIKPEEQMSVAETMEKKFHSNWNLKNEIKEAILNAIIANRLNEGSEEIKENLAAAYLIRHRSGEDENGEWQEIDPDYQNIVNAIFGPITSFNEIPETPETQKIFLFLIATGIKANTMPDIDDSDEEWEQAEHSMFWKFAQIDKETYIQMYREFLWEAVKTVMAGQSAPEDEADEDYEE